MVYPRVYGESPAISSRRPPRRGLSPRVRGILHVGPDRGLVGGSIPACTGNPANTPHASDQPQVYPRVYGESESSRSVLKDFEGLSPRVRGIRLDGTDRVIAERSIPACTGNPPRQAGQAESEEVYPRVYGESPAPGGGGSGPRGLSPRVRGIRRLQYAQRVRAGSIPACTGNPAESPPWRTSSMVYPRVYGESSRSALVACVVGGLSPRVRGILVGRDEHVPRGGSIPACTGNPYCTQASTYIVKVYPRVYGESASREPGPGMDNGLSPRVRGIRAVDHGSADGHGSIPACTGNPPSGRLRNRAR